MEEVAVIWGRGIIGIAIWENLLKYWVMVILEYSIIAGSLDQDQLLEKLPTLGHILVADLAVSAMASRRVANGTH